MSLPTIIDITNRDKALADLPVLDLPPRLEPVPESTTLSTSQTESEDTTGALAGGIGSSLLNTGSNIVGQVIGQITSPFENILSLARGRNLPSGGEAFRKVGSAINLEPTSGDDWRVRINANWSLFNDSRLFKVLEDTGGVVFPVLPEITFGTQADYDSISPAHSNYAYQAYKSSQIRDISIMGNFFAETERDAAYWISATTFFRTATKMFFGQGENVGNPPIICNLSGYGTSMFNNVPVVIKSFDITLPQDVNYIRCNTYDTNTWVPVLSTITVSLAPVYNRERQRQFDLVDFANGTLVTDDNIGWL